MQSTAFSLFVSIAILSSNPAFAEGHGRQKGQKKHESAGQQYPAERIQIRRNVHRNDWGRDNMERDNRWAQRGAGPNHDFRRGDHLPMEYRHRNYVVDDWRGHNLSAPPRGYHWVQSGADYILVAIASGLILQILLNH